MRGRFEAEFRKRARHTMIDLPGGQQASVAALMTGFGIGGQNALATVAKPAAADAAAGSERIGYLSGQMLPAWPVSLPGFPTG